MQRGFTLVELSIVLVILGLLTGGILAGQSLIRASELRSVTTEFHRYVTATQSFRDKYFALPGDMSNATKFWTSAGGTGSNGACQAVTTTTTTCNGDGNGLIAIFNSNGVNESPRFWQQLSLAGLIEGAYTGSALTAIGTSAPVSKIGSATWMASGTAGYITGDAYGFGGEYGNSLQYFNFPSGLPLKPEEAWNIDTKTDDGKPGYGKIYAAKGDGTTVICTTGDNIAPPGDANAEYATNRSSKDCALIFLKAL